MGNAPSTTTTTAAGSTTTSPSRTSTYPGQRVSSYPAHRTTSRPTPGGGLPSQAAGPRVGGLGVRPNVVTATTTSTGSAGGAAGVVTDSSGGSTNPNLPVPPSTPPPPSSSSPSSPVPGGGTGGGGGASSSSNTTTAQTLSAPGAYSISRNDAGPTQVFRVSVPNGVSPGQDFQVYAGTRVVRVRCPPDIRPGQSLQITVPPDPVVRQNVLGMAPLTCVDGEGGGGAVRMSVDIRRVNEGRLEGGSAGASGAGAGAGASGEERPEDDGEEGTQSTPAPTPPPQPQPQPQTYTVTIPPGVMPGQRFAVSVSGQQMLVQCPPNAAPGMTLQIVPPTPPSTGNNGTVNNNSSSTPGTSTSLDRPPDRSTLPTPAPRPQLSQQMFEVIVPNGVRPNQPFALIAGGQRVLVTCPPNAHPGQRIRFQLPVTRPSTKSIESVKLSYDKDGWTRTIRVTDMKFQWVRMDEKGDVDTSSRFDIKHSAYVRDLTLLAGNDPRMRTGKVSLVPASEAAVDSKVENPAPPNRELVTYADIADVQTRPYAEKARWFNETCQRLTIDWNEGHMRFNVRRRHLLADSINAVMSLGMDDLRKMWRFEFMGEVGVDAGGLAREWFHLVSQQIFDPDIGLWLSGGDGGNQMYMRINPASEISCPEDHLIYFRFLGRVMGKALFDRQLIAGHMVRPYYKHILGWPVTFEDLQLIDEEYYNSLKKLHECDDVSMLCLDFTTTEETLGVKKEVQLVENGSDVEVTNENLPEYLEACLKYRMLDRIRPQLTELLLGFFDVIPEPLLTIFHFQELELLMCGLPEIDLDDWQGNTIYSGKYETVGADHEVCKWFWDIVKDDFDQETRARLLQFVTGTSGVPSRGFSVLQGNDGNIRKFTIHGVDLGVALYPRSHTCFNRIDLPMYTSKEDLHEKLKVAVTMLATGFDME